MSDIKIIIIIIINLYVEYVKKAWMRYMQWIDGRRELIVSVEQEKTENFQNDRLTNESSYRSCRRNKTSTC